MKRMKKKLNLKKIDKYLNLIQIVSLLLIHALQILIVTDLQKQLEAVLGRIGSRVVGFGDFWLNFRSCGTLHRWSAQDRKLTSRGGFVRLLSGMDTSSLCWSFEQSGLLSGLLFKSSTVQNDIPHWCWWLYQTKIDNVNKTIFNFRHHSIISTLPARSIIICLSSMFGSRRCLYILNECGSNSIWIFAHTSDFVFDMVLSWMLFFPHRSSFFSKSIVNLFASMISTPMMTSNERFFEMMNGALMILLPILRVSVVWRFISSGDPVADTHRFFVWTSSLLNLLLTKYFSLMNEVCAPESIKHSLGSLLIMMSPMVT